MSRPAPPSPPGGAETQKVPAYASLVKYRDLEHLQAASLAEAYNVRVNPHSPYFGPGLLATAHLVASSPVADWVEYLYVTLEASVFKQAPRFEKGFFHLPSGPGLGLEVDMDVIREYSVAI